MPLIALATTSFGCVSLVAGLWDKSGRQQHAIAHVWAQRPALHQPLPRHRRRPRKARSLTRPPSTPPTTSATTTPPSSSPSSPSSSASSPSSPSGRSPSSAGTSTAPARSPSTSSARSAIASLLRGVATLKAGMPLVLFPEGGRAATRPAPDLPLRRRLHGHQGPGPARPHRPHRHLRAPPHPHLPPHAPAPSSVIVGDPIPTTGLTTRDADALTKRLYDAITTTYLQHHA